MQGMVSFEQEHRPVHGCFRQLQETTSTKDLEAHSFVMRIALTDWPSSSHPWPTGDGMAANPSNACFQTRV